MKRGWVLGLLAAFGCTAGASDDAPVSGDSAMVQATDTAAAPLAMPAIPVATSGRLAIVIATADEKYSVNDAWDASGGRCEDSGLIQLIARGSGVGVGIMIAVPDSGSENTYAVMEGDRGKPKPSTARVVVQIYGDDRAYVLRGVAGEIEMDSVRSSSSGHLTATLVERIFRDTVLVAGAFDSVPLPTLGAAECELLEEKPDDIVRRQ